MDRRTFNTMLTTALGAAMLRGSAVHAQSIELRMIEAGGKSGESIETGYIKPFTASTGIKVVRESPNEIGKLQALVASGSSNVQIFELNTGALEQAKALGLIEPLDWKEIAPGNIFPEARNEYGLGYQYFSTIMAWRKGVKPLNGWVDFFNTRDFPGKRTIADEATLALPAAAIAAGVPMDKLYPLDVDLAFKTLAAIKNDVSVWWKAGAQSPQLLNDNEVQYAMSYSGRVTGQEKIEYTFKQGNLDLAFMTIVKGTSGAALDAVNRLFREMSLPQNQAVAASVIPYTGNSPDLDKFVSRDKLDEFPTTTANKEVQFLNDSKWWFEHGEATQRRWQEFMLSL